MFDFNLYQSVDFFLLFSVGNITVLTLIMKLISLDAAMLIILGWGELQALCNKCQYGDAPEFS